MSERHQRILELAHEIRQHESSLTTVEGDSARHYHERELEKACASLSDLISPFLKGSGQGVDARTSLDSLGYGANDERIKVLKRLMVTTVLSEHGFINSAHFFFNLRKVKC